MNPSLKHARNCTMILQIHVYFIQVTVIKKTVAACIRKHVITPSGLASLEKPVILIAWGCYIEMEFNDLAMVKKFTATRGLLGPEGHFPMDGLYTHLQTVKADKLEGEEDNILCDVRTETDHKKPKYTQKQDADVYAANNNRFK